MTAIALYIIALLPATLCVGVAGYMAMNGYSGWGWFLFVAVLLAQVEIKSPGGKK